MSRSSNAMLPAQDPQMTGGPNLSASGWGGGSKPPKASARVQAADLKLKELEGEEGMGPKNVDADYDEED